MGGESLEPQLQMSSIWVCWYLHSSSRALSLQAVDYVKEMQIKGLSAYFSSSGGAAVRYGRKPRSSLSLGRAPSHYHVPMHLPRQDSRRLRCALVEAAVSDRRNIMATDCD